MKRRDFIKLTTVNAIACGIDCSCSAESPNSALAPEELYAKHVPADKNLSADWIASLTRRGHPLDNGIAYSNNDVDLEVIGMTVGGIGCGTVYLSGDGRLWVWDIFNQHHEGVVPNKSARAPEGLRNINGRNPIERDGANFLRPPRASEHTNGVDVSFALQDGDSTRRMDQSGWSSVKFTGRWPIGRVEYSDSESQVQATLEAYSPFIPLNLKDSSLPTTVMEYTLKNNDSKPRKVNLFGNLSNALGQFSNSRQFRRSSIYTTPAAVGIQHCLQVSQDTLQNSQEDRFLFSFDAGDYEGWAVDGTAFGSKPATRQTQPSYMGDTNAVGTGYVNSHASADISSTGHDVDAVSSRDSATGKLISPVFTMDRRYLTFRVGGGSNQLDLAIDLVVEDKVVASTTGHNSNQMRDSFFDLHDWHGQEAHLVIRDSATDSWGNIGADHFVLTDRHPNSSDLSSQLDYGSMSLAVVGAEDPEVSLSNNRVGVRLALPAGESKTVRFIVTWHIPNLHPATGQGDRKRHYSTRFSDSQAVATHVSQRLEKLSTDTRTWVNTWNDSTIPQWLLDRAILTTNTLQTQNSIIFDNGQFWAWEGIGCCEGTCGHVWQYSQGHARLFPEIERNLREVTDYAIAQKEDGSIRFRGINNDISAIDSQCAYVLRTLRDHQLADDPTYLSRVWPSCRKAIEYLIEFDKKDPRGGLDGLLDGEQHNTLDAEWFGKVHVLCSMYLAALRAAAEMSEAMDDSHFAERCRAIYELGSIGISRLYNGEYYEQIEDPDHSDAIGVGRGCYIDQVMGQFWANQVGLGRLYNAEHQKSALRAIWKYNFVPHYGKFRASFTEGRHYAAGDDSGLLMCTWPNGGLREDFKRHWQYAYFNECMTGFEYQVAAHMVAEGDDDLVQKGLAITRAIHDRYSATRGRNPYNEIECSDHYARAGSSYAVFLALSGFEFDQSSGRLSFSPVVQNGDFKTPFTTSRAWGTYHQKGKKATLAITYGTLLLNQLELAFAGNARTYMQVNGRPVELPGLKLVQGDCLTVSMSSG